MFYTINSIMIYMLWLSNRSWLKWNRGNLLMRWRSQCPLWKLLIRGLL